MVVRVPSILRPLCAVVFVCACSGAGGASLSARPPPGAWTLELVPQLVSADTFEISLDAAVSIYLGASGGEALFVRLADIDAVQTPQRCGAVDDPWPCGLAGLSWLAGQLGSDPVLCVAPLRPSLRPALAYRASSAADAGDQLVAHAFPVSAHAVRCSTAYLGDLSAALVGAGWALPVAGAPPSLNALARAAARNGVGVYSLHRSGPWDLIPGDWLLNARAVSRAALHSSSPTVTPKSLSLDPVTRARHLSADPLSAADRAR